ncbi:threonine aldolase family protein [Rhizobium leguminosarum]|uniref:threonine aldolase family protein n=1 Tax=Rhizobium leguminosarum TaxID=384 RepID=UPI00055CBE70|nr:GntG family PLP-dependent aldolase [Rhizobium leguminosarum]
MEFIDLYSDTKTKPTPAMRERIARAVVGDEQKDEDPTTRELVERVAEQLGQESAVLLPSGTMCNEIALAVHCKPGDEIICERGAHIVNYETGGPAALAGVMIHTIDGHRGMFDSEQLSAAIRGDSRYFPRSRLVCLEQTANLGGGAVWPIEKMRDVVATGRNASLALHLDGARLFNASVASGLSTSVYGTLFDSVWVDFTKGLGAPVGAVLAGSRDFIKDAWRLKQRWGGAMRQSGMIAAGCLHALDEHVTGLELDHRNARSFADIISQLPGVRLDKDGVETNIVFFDIEGTGWLAGDLVARAKEQNIGIGAFGKTLIRIVTHLDTPEHLVRKAAEKIAHLLSKPAR